jgi:hypothetical protein
MTCHNLVNFGPCTANRSLKPRYLMRAWHLGLFQLQSFLRVHFPPAFRHADLPTVVRATALLASAHTDLRVGSPQSNVMRWLGTRTCSAALPASQPNMALSASTRLVRWIWVALEDYGRLQLNLSAARSAKLCAQSLSASARRWKRTPLLLLLWMDYYFFGRAYVFWITVTEDPNLLVASLSHSVTCVFSFFLWKKKTSLLSTTRFQLRTRSARIVLLKLSSRSRTQSFISTLLSELGQLRRTQERWKRVFAVRLPATH